MIEARISRTVRTALASLVVLAFCACDTGSNDSIPQDATSGNDVPIADLLDELPAIPDVPPEDPAGPDDLPPTGEDSGLDVAQDPGLDGALDTPPVEDSGADVMPDACVPECGALECGPDPVCGVECGPCSQGYACSDERLCVGFPGMAFVAAGPFWMGCNEAVEDDCSFTEKPYHQVTLKSFFIDRTEVTVAAYDACVQASACDTPTIESEWCHYGKEGVAALPMNCVRWAEAADYCDWAGKRLPTEAEWEKAARGPDGAVFPWGDDPITCDRAIIMDASGRGCGRNKRGGQPEKGKPWPVGSRPAGAYGLRDMAGNSWEWVADWYSKDWTTCGAACAGPDPKGPCDGAASCKGHRMKVVRGGSWYWPGSHAAGYYRRPHVPSNNPYHHFGFRCAADLPATP